MHHTNQHKYCKYFLPVIILFISNIAQAQFYFNTKLLLSETKYYRKKQKVHSIQSAYVSGQNLVVNFTATLDKKVRNQAWHIVLAIDTILSFYNNARSIYDYVILDSVARTRYGVAGIDNRFKNISGRQVAAGLDIMCLKKSVLPGFTDS